MEDPIRTGPVVRTSKFSLSSLKAIIRRKTKDDNDYNPYSTQSRRDSKPYMSQPMLVLSNPDVDTDNISDQSASPDRSSPLNINSYHLPLNHTRTGKVSAQSTASNNSLPIPDGLIKTQPNSNGTGTANTYQNAILPTTIETSRLYYDSISDSLKPGRARGPVKPPLSNPSKVRPSTPPSKLLPPIPAISLPLSSSGSDDSSNNTPKVNKLYTDTDRPVMITYSSTPALPLSVTSDGGNGNCTSNSERGDNSSVLSVLEESPSSVSRQKPVNLKLTVNTTLDTNNGSNQLASSTINTTSSQQPLFPPIQPRRTVSTAPRLSLPPANYRFSLNLIDGYSARLSPSVILRPPPLPLLNLPALPGSTTTSIATSRRSRRAGLMSMPALPRQGSSRGTAGHEEFDDVEEDDDDDEDDGDGDDDHVSPDSAPLGDEVDTSRSASVSTSETILSSRSHSHSPSSTSSYDTTRAAPSTPREAYFGDLTRPPERRFSRSPRLPPVDMSRIDLSFLDSPFLDNKGKSKALTEDAGRTPIAGRMPIAAMRPNKNGSTASNSTPAFNRMDFSAQEETATDTWALPAITKAGQPSSPTLTPRLESHFNFLLSVPIPPSPRPLLPTRSTDDRSSVSMNTITQFPGTYKRASRSLIDIHALEKKEKAKQMMSEEEEDAEEERKRRVKAMRMSMRVVVEGANAPAVPFKQQSSGDGYGESKPSPHSGVPRRMSLAPHWVDRGANEDDDPIKASEASIAAAKPPKGNNNRISMAPAYDTIIPLRRRLSMPTFNSTSTAPPPYPNLFPGPQSQGAHAQNYGVKPTQIQPRDDEGQEKLPAYSNSIYLKAIMPRKVEFSQPGIQSKDRKWKRVLCVLEGTSFKIYKPPGVSALGGWWESKVGVGDMAVPITTTSSFNSGGGRQRVQGGDSAGAGGAAYAIGQNKGEVERESRQIREVMMGTTTWPAVSQNNATSGHSRSTSSSSYPSSATTGGGGNAPSASTNGVLPVTKSAINLAVHLLKPSSRGHGRTISDVGRSSNALSVPRSPRPSLNIPRNGMSTPTPTIASRTSVSSSRSPSPMFVSSSSLLTTSATSGSSHRSMDSTISLMGSGSDGCATSRMVANNTNYTVSASSPSTSKGKKKVEDSDPSPDANSLIKVYTMQQAECGLGSDYVKRKHVIRVRLEGEQFLLQAKDVDSVIGWIEGLQAATNVAMDLDERPMPRGPLFPRRRRRRRVVVDTEGVRQTTRISPSGNMSVDALQLAPPLV